MVFWKSYFLMQKYGYLFGGYLAVEDFRACKTKLVGTFTNKRSQVDIWAVLN